MFGAKFDLPEIERESSVLMSTFEGSINHSESDDDPIDVDVKHPIEED